MPVPPIVLQSKSRSTHYFIATAIITSFIIWFIFKLIYPYPFITIDSYYYIGAAYENANAGSWPIGYSKFIRIVGYLSHSPTLLVTIQYLVLQLSFIYLFLSIRNIFQIGKWSSLILFIFLFLNPLFIYGSNHIMSDIVFCSFAICWICQLLWIIKRPRLYMIFTQAFLLTTIFTIRYTALYFPLFTIMVFIISNQSTWCKISGIGLTLLLLGAFIQFTRIKMEEVGGIRQFSSASGWKQASNALYMYGHIAAVDNTPVPDKFKVLHQLTKNYFKGPHTYVDLYSIDKEFTTGSFYVAAYESPLMQYLRTKQGENADVFEFKNIAPFGPFFNSYGTYLITHYPLPYIQYVILPDIMAYLLPFPEIYGTPNDLYYLWSNHLGVVAKNWFEFTTITILTNFIKIRGIILSPYPLLFFIIHVIYILSLIAILLQKHYKKWGNIIRKSYFLLVLICTINFLFTILSAASVLRFQFTFIIIEFVIALISIKLIMESAARRSNNHDSYNGMKKV
ncbi:hypothetical protein [Chitinophaga sancti]|uniref:Dolichyl-phosphate-mannose-protein mannosyltransferase n=1 Tax=Chitinophaga sancti TaxID=1004 RepID=A0A1K1T0D3_9BACT|nr:hypothetical protein [Chitinophaga sancti]WQD59563.1 hypothetical protein U0033_16845 [Chitinophaga sancti]WQG88303.1 hypothetical protein SR876_25620 [Chitinophaga sancti]SFW89956.1 hypothetical protein SAMN05661012_06529 [Chitinophaga sancti]